jgi:hypothetical protein|tara:strand:+ start:152 stop:724 length:573 start_codon:yes stop_codon:yes gene_type:complete
MAVKTMEQNTGTSLYSAGWHELTISAAKYDTWTNPTGTVKTYIEIHFEGYPENMHLRIYEARNRETNIEFKIANLFRYACAGIITVLKDPTGKKPVIQYDDEAENLVGTRINAFFYKKTDAVSGNEYSRIFDTVAPVEQETEHIIWTADQVTKLKASAEKNFTRVKEATVVDVPTTTVKATTTSDAELPF